MTLFRYYSIQRNYWADKDHTSTELSAGRFICASIILFIIHNFIRSDPDFLLLGMFKSFFFPNFHYRNTEKTLLKSSI